MGVPHVFLHRKRTAPAASRSEYTLIRLGRIGEKDMRSYGKPGGGAGRDLIAVAMPDAVLVARADRAQDVKLAVSALKAKGARQAETLNRDFRPWGWYESLVIGDRFQVKPRQAAHGVDRGADRQLFRRG